MKTYGEWRYSSTILILGTGYRREVSFTPLLFYLRERASVTHCIGGWVCLSVDLDVTKYAKNKNATPLVVGIMTFRVATD
jgi:hypothetical protein